MEAYSSNNTISNNNLLKSICPIVKQLDERQKAAKSLRELFGESVNEKRFELISLCEEVMYEDEDCVSTKPREILWRKGYYETISLAKRLLKLSKSNHSKEDLSEDLQLIGEFLNEGIDRLKRLIIGIEKNFNLDLQFLINLRLFTENQIPNHEDVPINKKITSLEIINFALETIHSLIISLGDLHRYYLDLGLDKICKTAKIDQNIVSSFYFEAFQLNPKVGMPQNQLGTLLIGRNQNLDSVYHYLYSLICPKPFEMSDDNVCKIFLQNGNFLEALKIDEDYKINLKDFIARYLLIVDILFYDKNVGNFNELCGFLLMDLNILLKSEKNVFTQDILFKFVSILFFCMVQLRRVNSQKVYHLNAFLAAICDQLVDACIANFDRFFKDHKEENDKFIKSYQKRYEKYNNLVMQSRENEKTDEKIPINGKCAIKNGFKDDQTMVNSLNSNGIMSLNSQNGMLSSSGPDQPLAGTSSSLEAKSNDRSSDGKPAKNKIKMSNLRRRRRKISFSSDSDLTSNFDSDSEGEESDNFSNFSDDSEEMDSDNENSENELEEKIEKIDLNSNQSNHNSDSDILIEEEKIVYINENGVDSDGLEFVEEVFHFPIKEPVMENVKIDKSNVEEENIPPKDRLRYKISLCHYDPNLMLKFSESEPTILALKICFDWLMNNKEIILECYQSNPKFVHKIMTLLNDLNINIFTRKVFFDMDMLTYPGLRQNIRDLFEERSKIPIKEDILLKHFTLFQINQQGLDWEIHSRLQVTKNEENLMRLVKLKNFGFFICDRKKFGYTFKNRIFEQSEAQPKKQKNKKNFPEKKFNGEKKRERNKNKKEKRNFAKNNWKDSDSNFRNTPEVNKKGYLRKRTDSVQSKENGYTNGNIKKEEAVNKNELMGKLWLRSEVKSLESKMKKPKGLNLLTPYIMIDTKALTEYTLLVKSLVKMKRFIVLIPAAVLTELDDLKLGSDKVRNCIRWLEQEFSNGSRFLRTQKAPEKLPLPYFKPPKKMDRDTNVFLQIVQFCNYIVSNNRNQMDDQSVEIVTLLTGEDMSQSRTIECNFAAILDSIPVKCEKIDKFYGKLNKK